MAKTEKAKDMLKRFKKTSSIPESGIFSDSEIYTIKESIPTPIPAVNLALSGKFFTGGLSKGLTVLAGASKSFKTMLGLLCLKTYLDTYEDSIGLLYDSEFSFSPEYLSSFGIDTSRVFISPITDIDKLKNDIVNQIDEVQFGERVFILIDSIGNLASLKEISDAHDGKSTMDMSRAKMLKSLFRMITPRINLKNIPMFVINHTYENIGSMYSKTIVSGGTGVMYSANTVIIMRRRKNKEASEGGYDFAMKVEKSRFVAEGIEFPLIIPEKGAIKKYSGLFDLALSTGYLVKDGMKYIVPELPNFEKVWKKEIEDDETFWKMMFEKTSFIKSIEEGVKVSIDQSDLFNAIIGETTTSPDNDGSETVSESY